MPPVDPLIAWIVAACLATLLAHAAVAKWADLPLFEQHLAAYGLRQPGLLALVSRGLPLLEAATALALVSPWRAGGAWAAVALLGGYGLVMAQALARGQRPDCGCGGEPLQVSWLLVGRNALLAALAWMLSWPLAPRALALADFIVVVAALLLATLLYAALHQVLRHRAGARTVSWRN